VVGILTTLRNWMGHKYLMDAIAALSDLPDIRLLLVGDTKRDEISHIHH
jgi:hypothetical protein